MTLWALRQTYDFVMGITIACTFVDIARFPSTDNDLYLKPLLQKKDMFLGWRQLRSNRQ